MLFLKILKWISKSVCLLCMLCKRLYIAELFTHLLFRCCVSAVYCCVSVCKITNAESANTHLTQQTQHFSISSEIISVACINAAIASCSFTVFMTLDVCTILDFVLLMVLFQPQVEHFLFHDISAVKSAPVTITAVQICCGTFKFFSELHKLFVF